MTRCRLRNKYLEEKRADSRIVYKAKKMIPTIIGHHFLQLLGKAFFRIQFYIHDLKNI